MIDQLTVDHHIQKYIMSGLMHRKHAKFSELKPKKVDSNLYSYHLKLLQRNGFVLKQEQGYTLDHKGLLFVDRVNTKSLNIRSQPKIITMLVIQNSDGAILLFKRKRQPFTDTWTLPYGKLHIEDTSIHQAALREAGEKLALKDVAFEHAGDCYIRTAKEGEVLMSTLAHVFRGYTDAVDESEILKWVRPTKLNNYDLAPAVEQIITRTFFKDPYFFEEYTQSW